MPQGPLRWGQVLWGLERYGRQGEASHRLVRSPLPWSCKAGGCAPPGHLWEGGPAVLLGGTPMTIKAAQWGRDHQSLMLYFETICVDHSG